MNVAFDANIWVSFTIGKHISILRHILLDSTLSEKLVVHGCTEIITEYERVMKRPKLKKYVTQQRIQETIELIDRVVEDHIITLNVTGARDLNDNYLLALAEIVPLDYLVTGDKDLLILEKWQQTYIINFASFVGIVQ